MQNNQQVNDPRNMMFPNSFFSNALYQGMPQACVPKNTDILCGRGKTNARHPGNAMFNALIKSNVKDYNNAKTRIEKSIVVNTIVSYLSDAGSRFLKFDTKFSQYVELTSDGAHEKVGHAIRDLIKLEKRKRVSKQAKKTSKQLPTPDPVESTSSSSLPNEALSAAATTSSIEGDSKIRPLSSCDPLHQMKFFPTPNTNDIFSLAGFEPEDDEVTLEKMISSLGAVIEDDDEELLADIVSMKNDAKLKQQSSKPLPLDSSANFEHQDAATLDHIFGMDQL